MGAVHHELYRPCSPAGNTTGGVTEGFLSRERDDPQGLMEPTISALPPQNDERNSNFSSSGFSADGAALSDPLLSVFPNLARLIGWRTIGDHAMGPTLWITRNDRRFRLQRTLRSGIALGIGA